MVKLLKITAQDLDANGCYVGAADASNWGGHIEIDRDLGTVTFPTGLYARGRITALAGSGIKAGRGIKAGFSITCKILSAQSRVFAGLCLRRLPTVEERHIMHAYPV